MGIPVKLYHAMGGRALTSLRAQRHLNKRADSFKNAGRRVAKAGAYIASTAMNTIRKAQAIHTQGGKTVTMHKRPTIADRGGKKDLLLPSPNSQPGRPKRTLSPSTKKIITNVTKKLAHKRGISAPSANTTSENHPSP